MQFVLQRQQRAERLLASSTSGAAAVFQPILRQIADGQIRRSDDLPASGSSSSRQDFQQRRLAGAVRAAQPHTIPRIQLPGDIVEQHTIGKRLAKFHQLQHAAIVAGRTNASTPQGRVDR